ncbi:G-protein coupled receptor 98 [Cricetulus griseus]|uniref:G-protein coupled receptor 98 n=1 Tax=Cricetulus griseus TaxID=10029 RepID=G3HL67_CRIGR|nr:G-protein coupled receptor 98 [Cricetulus griseus]
MEMELMGDIWEETQSNRTLEEEREEPGPKIVFLASAYASPHFSEESCSAVAAVAHYLYLCQFSWMLIQSVNFWYVLVMNDEHTERRYLLFCLLSWGLPSFVVILLIVILRGIYHQNMPQIYGLIHGDL